jgi:hypothetical protein
MVDESIHHPGDGRGPRWVLCNGKRMERVVWADVRRGVARYHRYPQRLTKHTERFVARTRRGKITIEYIDG